MLIMGDSENELKENNFDATIKLKIVQHFLRNYYLLTIVQINPSCLLSSVYVRIMTVSGM